MFKSSPLVQTQFLISPFSDSVSTAGVTLPSMKWQDYQRVVSSLGL